MKKITVVLISSFLFSCGNSEKVEISKEEYNKLKGLENPRKVNFTESQSDQRITKASDGHDYYSQRVGGYSAQYIWLHYIECEKCKKSAKNENNL